MTSPSAATSKRSAPAGDAYAGWDGFDEVKILPATHAAALPAITGASTAISCATCVPLRKSVFRPCASVVCVNATPPSRSCRVPSNVAPEFICVVPADVHATRGALFTIFSRTPWPWPTTRGMDAAAEMVIVALADFVVSVMEVAVNMTVGGLGNAPGAVNIIGVPDALVAADKLPHEAPPHSEPASVQVTPLFEESPVTVAVKVVVAFTATVAFVCERDTEIPAGAELIVIVAEADFVPSLMDVASIVTVGGFG